MRAGWWYRFLMLFGIVTVCCMMVIPTALDFDENSSFPVKSKINLGLDLQGGLYMVLGIDFRKVYRDEIRGYAIKIVDVAKEQLEIAGELGEADVADPFDPKFSVTFAPGSDLDKVHEQVKEYFPAMLRLTQQTDTKLQYALATSIKTRIEDQSVQKSIEVIRNRIDEFGVTEPEIFSQGKDRIIVQLPGVRDIDRAKELIGKTAKLEFKIVNTEQAAVLSDLMGKAKDQGIEFKQGKDRFSDYVTQMNRTFQKDLPKGYILAFQKTVSKATNQVTSMIPYLVEANAQITGDDLQDARVQFDQQKNEPYVSMTFKTRGANKFEEITGDNVGKPLAIILDGNVYSAPNINERIGGGRAQINLGSGGDVNALIKEATDIALVLRAGALPVQLDFLEQRIVGPSLGQDSIDRARKASLIGAVLVFIFILIYYKVSGFFALTTLGINVLIVMACLIAFEATLTLPGIAGIALTIGMAVDANIIIYERIREEIKRGLTNFKAVQGGFEQAFWTIIDANITTALAGLCLLNFGTGPIKGFAVTLLIGIVATVYSSYFVSKMFFELYMNKVSGNELSI